MDRFEDYSATILEGAAVRIRHGYLRIHILLRREGWAVNRKCVYGCTGRRS